MRSRNYKGKVVKVKMKKCEEVVRAYDRVQLAYAYSLDQREDIASFRCNVPISDELTTDFVLKMRDGSTAVRECVCQSVLCCKVRNKIVDRLDYSRNFWASQKVDDWGIVVDEEK